MTGVRLPPSIGALANVGYAMLVGVPYLLVPDSRAGVLGTYYGFGPIDPPVLALFALVGAIAFVGGGSERTDPATAAGAALVAGMAVLAFTLLWVLAVDISTLAAVPGDWIDWHRWAVLLLAAIPALVAAWYTRALGLF